MESRLCCIFNYAPHYRMTIYSLIDKELGADFYFADKLQGGETIKKLDFSKLKGFEKEIKAHFGRHFEYTEGWIKLAFNRKYRNYLITPSDLAINQWLFLLLCWIQRKQVYVWMHGLKSKKNSRKGLLLFKLYTKLLRGAFIYGQYAIDNMVELGMPEEKFILIHNSLDYNRHLSIRNNLKESDIYKDRFNNNDRTIFFIGRLIAGKSLDLLIDAVVTLKRQGKNYNLVFVGDGEEKSKLIELCDKKGLNNVWFYGASYDEQVNAELLYNADLCVSPGNVGLTAIHSLTFGTPVITNSDFESQMPEFESIKDGVTGAFFDKSSSDSLASTISKWFQCHSNDREIVRQACYDEIAAGWTPEFQINVFKKYLS